LYIHHLEKKFREGFFTSQGSMSDPSFPYTNGNSVGGQNGRVNLLGLYTGEKLDIIPGYTHETKVETDFQADMLRGNWETNALTSAFFSVKNIMILQNAIRKEVFERSQPKGYVIDEQSIDELKIIMRAMYYQYARNLPTDIPVQVLDLNQKVIDWSVPHILSAVDHYYYYLNDISHMPVPLQMPQSMSSAGTKTLPLNPYM
jgi:hypothetical protein